MTPQSFFYPRLLETAETNDIEVDMLESQMHERSALELLQLLQAAGACVERMKLRDFSEAFPRTENPEIKPFMTSLEDMRRQMGAWIRELTLYSQNLCQSTSEMVTLSSGALKRSRTMKSNTEALQQATDDLTRNMNQAAAAAEELSVNMHSVSSRADESARNVSSVSQSVEQMTATIGEIARNSELARQTVEQAMQNVAAATRIMSELEKAAIGINSVTTTISGISDQTKLLALNATIEAARAGEAGLRFGVVANEVKALAGETNQATRHIREKVETMQQASQKALSEIHRITTVMDEVNRSVVVIAAAVEEQSVTAREISGNVGKVASGVMDMSRNAGEAHHAVQEVTTNITQAAQHSERLLEQISHISSENMEMRNDAVVLYASAMESSSRGDDIKTLTSTLRLPSDQRVSDNEQIEMFHFSDFYLVGVSQLDLQHQGLFDYFNKIHNGVKRRTPLKELIPLLRNMAGYAVDHFSSEEKLMQRANFSGLDQHRAAHIKLTNDLQSSLDRLERTGDVNILELCRFLKDWIVNHIQVMDKKYMDSMQRAGIK
jgi:hemerythrin-like metal-binding protein